MTSTWTFWSDSFHVDGSLAPVMGPGSTSTWQGDHYGFLRTLETSLGLPTLKSRAADPAAARTVHDGDPGVTPLTDVWQQATVSAATAAAAPAPAPARAVAPAPAGPLPATGRAQSLAIPVLMLATGLALRRRSAVLPRVDP